MATGNYPMTFRNLILTLSVSTLFTRRRITWNGAYQPYHAPNSEVNFIFLKGTIGIMVSDPLFSFREGHSSGGESIGEPPAPFWGLLIRFWTITARYLKTGGFSVFINDRRSFFANPPQPRDQVSTQIRTLTCSDYKILRWLHGHFLVVRHRRSQCQRDNAGELTFDFQR